MPRARKRVKVAPNDAEPIEPTDAAPPEEHTVNHDKAEADDNDLQADVVSNASSAPTFDDIEAVDLALFDEEEAPGYPAGITTGAGAKKKATPVHNVTSGGFNALKSFNGQIYSGMAIGGSHTWNYDQGVWKETKEEPDLWKIDFETTKRRARNAPRGSGAPVGTEYHWLIVAHQVSTDGSCSTRTRLII